MLNAKSLLTVFLPILNPRSTRSSETFIKQYSTEKVYLRVSHNLCKIRKSFFLEKLKTVEELLHKYYAGIFLRFVFFLYLLFLLLYNVSYNLSKVTEQLCFKNHLLMTDSRSSIFYVILQ